jgi:hypothetical protein
MELPNCRQANQWRWLLATVGIFLIVAAGTVLRWDHENINTPRGDEPHYLVVADSLYRQHSLEVTAAYEEEFREHRALQDWGDPNQPLTFANSHSVIGPNGGRYGFHGLGLSFLVGPAFLLGGVLAVRIFLIVLSSGVVALAWCFARGIGAGPRLATVVAGTTTVAMPLVPAGGQIFPEVPACGAIFAGMWWLLRAGAPSRSGDALIAVALAALPWLHFKFLLPALILGLATSGRTYGCARRWSRVVVPAVLYAASWGLLLATNVHMYGHVSGSFATPELRVANPKMDRQSVMTFLGLHLDQDQGLFFYAPILLVGLFFAGAFVVRYRLKAAVWLAVYLSVIVPGAMQPVTYGATSFIGRFSWIGAVLWVFPTLVGLVQLRTRAPRLLACVLVLSTALQTYFFFNYALGDTRLYNRVNGWSDDRYSVFFPAVHGYLPKFKTVGWAFDYAPNFAWCALAGAFAVAGIVYGSTGVRRHRVLAAAAIGVGGMAVVAAGASASPPPNEVSVPAVLMRSDVGQLIGGSRTVSEGEPGFLAYGAHLWLRDGHYALHCLCRGTGAPDRTVGEIQVYQPSRHLVVQRSLITGDAGPADVVGVRLTQTARYELRLRWLGVGRIDFLGFVLTSP